MTEDFQNILIVHLYSAVFYSAQMNETFYSDTKNIYSGKVTQYQAAKTMVDFLQTLFGISFADTEILFLIYLFVKSQLKKERTQSKKTVALSSLLMVPRRPAVWLSTPTFCFQQRSCVQLICRLINPWKKH